MANKKRTISAGLHNFTANILRQYLMGLGKMAAVCMVKFIAANRKFVKRRGRV